ncbi:hypothetical protein L576_1710 [Bordetella bronchiseptica OSU054]|nr:hypothetical protein L576_1710 [Bordetella bronchiseptica OSU054]
MRIVIEKDWIFYQRAWADALASTNDGSRVLEPIVSEKHALDKWLDEYQDTSSAPNGATPASVPADGETSEDERAADSPIKAAYVENFGDAAGWLSYKGSWFIEGFKAAQKSAPVADEEVQPVVPDDESIAEAWVTASDSDGIAYDGHSFERGYQLGEIAERDRRASAPVAGEAQPAVEVVSRYGEPEEFGERDLKVLVDLNSYPYGTKFYAAPQASAEADRPTPAQEAQAERKSNAWAAAMNWHYDHALEAAAAAVENHQRAGRQWIPESLWGRLSGEAAARIRALKTTPAPTAACDHVYHAVTMTPGCSDGPSQAVCAKCGFAPTAAEGDVTLPPLPPIPHEWAPIIPPAFAGALQEWAQAYARAALAAPSQEPKP